MAIMAAEGIDHTFMALVDSCPPISRIFHPEEVQHIASGHGCITAYAAFINPETVFLRIVHEDCSTVKTPYYIKACPIMLQSCNFMLAVSV